MRVTWRPSPYQQRLLTVAALGIVAALVAARPAFAVLALAPLWLAATAPTARANNLDVEASLDQARCFEGEHFVLTARVVAAAPVALHAALQLPPGVMTDDELARASVDTTEAEFSWVLRAERWGRLPIGPVVVRAHGEGLLKVSTAQSKACELVVFPSARTVPRLPLPRTLPNRLGDHVSRAIGEGVEFAGIRPLVPGDSLRRLNWRATARYQRPFVTQFHAERVAELVVAVDGFSDVGPAGNSSLDISVRGAAALAHSYLDRHDRVGLIALGGILRWVGSQPGSTQFYRIIETLVEVRDFVSAVRPSLDRLPRAVLPAGALAVVFSPLLDERAIAVARDLRRRGFPLVVVDVLSVEPALTRNSAGSPMALRLWRLERQATRAALADIGAHVVHWDGVEPLDAALRLLPPAGRIA